MNDTCDVNDTGSVDDSRDALAGCVEALFIQNVSFQHGQLGLVLELCVSRRQVIGKLSGLCKKLPGKGGISLGLQGQLQWRHGAQGSHSPPPHSNTLGTSQQRHRNLDVQHGYEQASVSTPCHSRKEI